MGRGGRADRNCRPRVTQDCYHPGESRDLFAPGLSARDSGVRRNERRAKTRHRLIGTLKPLVGHLAVQPATDTDRADVGGKTGTVIDVD